jgi:hypothetical protein
MLHWPIEMNFSWGVGEFSIGSTPTATWGTSKGNGMQKIISADGIYLIPTNKKIDTHKDMNTHSQCHIMI